MAKMSKGKRDSLRRRLVERQGKKCFYCRRFGAFPLKNTVIEAGEKLWLTFDHILPRSRGGTDDIGNIVLACYLCHQKRHGARR